MTPSRIRAAVSNWRWTALACTLLVCIAVSSQQVVAQGYRTQLDTLLADKPLHGKGIKDTLRILFIGNSHTETNNLPRMFGMLASNHARVVIVGMIALGGATLHDHLEGPLVEQWLHKDRWNYVVLQDHGEAGLDPEKPNGLYDASRTFAPLIRKIGAQPVFYSTYSFQDKPSQQATITAAYAHIAREVKGTLVPVGAAWDFARKDTTLSLYRPDRYHPAAQGTYLVALMFYRVLLHASPLGLPAVIPDYDVENKPGYGEAGYVAPPGPRPTIRLLPSVAAALQRYANKARIGATKP